MSTLWNHEHPQFLQSEEWRRFQLTYGKECLVIPLPDLSVTAVKYKVSFGFSYWFILRGPHTHKTVSHTEAKTILNTIRTEIKKVDPRAVFFRFEPTTDLDTDSWKHVRDMYLQAGANKVPYIHPIATRLIDTTASEEDLLKGMSDSTRRNIAVASRRGIIVTKENTSEGFEAFWQMLGAMSKRRNVHLHPRKFYESVFNQFNASQSTSNIQANIYVARFEGTPIASSLIIHYRGLVTYFYGAQGDLHTDKKAQYALRWFVITDAKKLGCHTVDFFGENPGEKSDPDYRAAWEGFTQFKTGWGGTLVRFPGTFECSIRPLLYFLLRILRRVH